MLFNYIKLAFRNFRRQPFFTLLNIAGLSLGLACFSLIVLFVLDEFSFDRFHSQGDRTFRVVSHVAEGFRGEPEKKDPYQPMPLGPAIQRDFPEVESYARTRGWGGFVQAPLGLFDESFLFVDESFLKMFSFPVLYGTVETALKDPFSVVLTEKMATKMFGEANPVGRKIEIKIEDAFQPYLVSAVVKDVPSNSSIQFEILLPFTRYMAMPRGQQEIERWTRVSFSTFVRLREGSSLDKNPALFKDFYTRYHPEDDARARQRGWWSKAESPFGYFLQPIMDMRHNTSVQGPAVNPKNAWILLGIGALILLIACINFTTLTIGRSFGRAREIGVRKVVGAARSQLIGQHLSESILMSGVSMVLAFLLAQLLLPFFNGLTDRELAFNWQQFPELFWMFPCMALGAGLLAGAYPALVLSGFRPMESLQNKLRTGNGRNWFSKSLITGQFVLSTGLIICMVVMSQQLHFLKTQNPGFNKENVLVIDATGANEPDKTARLFCQKVRELPNVLHASACEISLGGEAGWSYSEFDYKGKPMQVYEYIADPEYIPALNLQLLSGRNLDAHIVADTQTSVVLNEAAVRAFGWSMNEALGQVLTGYDESNPSRDPVVVGVVKDYHFRSFREEVAPMMIQMFGTYPRENYLIRLNPGYPEATLSALQSVWTSVEPRLPFRYSFLDADLDAFYKTEQRWGQIISLASGFSLFLACLGLLGLAALAAVQRTKEIGIRKVLGASVAGITGLLAKDFVRLVLIAFVIASPMAYYFMQQWLADFAFRIQIHWWMFAIAGLTALSIAFLTVGFQSVKAALANPVKSLRNE
jgi:putative ABC transport system permease protein